MFRGDPLPSTHTVERKRELEIRLAGRNTCTQINLPRETQLRGPTKRPVKGEWRYFWSEDCLSKADAVSAAFDAHFSSFCDMKIAKESSGQPRTEDAPNRRVGDAVVWNLSQEDGSWLTRVRRQGVAARQYGSTSHIVICRTHPYGSLLRRRFGLAKLSGNHCYMNLWF
ncbi:hypothetical protein BDR04DRAFT_1104964, partial [Suillus decipiens]